MLDSPRSASSSDRDLLAHFIANDPVAGEELLNRLRPRVRQLLGRRIPFDPLLAPDQRDEVLGAALAGYAQNASRLSPYDPARGEVTTYLWTFLTSAARDVQARYTPPGQKTRPSREGCGTSAVRRHPLSLDREPTGAGSTEQATCLRDSLPDPRNAYTEVDARLEAAAYLVCAEATASPAVAQALALIYFDGCAVAAAERAVGMSPGELRRAIDRWKTAQQLEQPS